MDASKQIGRNTEKKSSDRGPHPLQGKGAAAPAAKGATFIDAPVSGGPHGSETGTLRIFVGGDAAAVESPKHSTNFVRRGITKCLTT